MAESNQCTAPTCTRQHRTTGAPLCDYHRQFLRSRGYLPAPPPTERERILARIDRDGPGGCWIWTGAADRNGTGYGCARYQGRNQGAHRVVYELLRGPIPDGLTLDHLCRVHICVNPDHLDPVTQKVNTQRAVMAATDTHCANGHPWADGNERFRPSDGARECRTCIREKAQRHRERKRATV